MRLRCFLISFLILLPFAFSVGIVPAKIVDTHAIGTDFTVSFRIFDKDGGYFELIPDSNVSQIIVPDCDYWCPNKTYYVEPNTYITNGTRVTLLLHSNISSVRGKVSVCPVSGETGFVTVRGCVALVLNLTFVQSSTTTTVPSTTTSSCTTTTSVPATTSIPTSMASIGGSGSGVVDLSAGFSVTTTLKPLTVTVGVSPAKVYLYNSTTITFKLWNDKGTVDGNFSIVPDENCSSLISNKLPSWIIVKKGTTMDSPVYLNVSFKKPEKEFECGISFLATPVGYNEIGMLRVRRGVTVRIFAQPLNVTITDTQDNSLILFKIIAVLALVGFIIFVLM